MATEVFSVPVFLIVFRETLETVIIVSVLLAFLKQTLAGPDSDARLYKRLRLQVWIGVAVGFFICMVASSAIIGIRYTIGGNAWEANEHWYEGAFCLLASVIITIMGAALLRIGKMQRQWRLKIAKTIGAPLRADSRRCFAHLLEKYAMFFLPFITILREGIEAVVFISGVSFESEPTAIPLPVFVGLFVGILIGWLLYKGGSTARMQLFLVLSSCLLYLVAAGLFSRAFLHFDIQKWNQAVGGDAAETGDEAGSYDIDKSVWHVNCCGPNGPNNSGWGIFNAILGWTNSATYGSVISYNVYWIAVVIGFVVMRFHETKGHWPLLKPKAASEGDSGSRTGSETRDGAVETKSPARHAAAPTAT